MPGRDRLVLLATEIAPDEQIELGAEELVFGQELSQERADQMLDGLRQRREIKLRNGIGDKHREPILYSVTVMSSYI